MSITGIATVQDIMSHGGREPYNGETKDHYYAEIKAWAQSQGHVVGTTSTGDLIITWTGGSTGIAPYTSTTQASVMTPTQVVTTPATGTPVTDPSEVPIVQAGVGTALIGLLPTVLSLLGGAGGIAGLTSLLTGGSNGSNGTTTLPAQTGTTSGTSSQVVTGGTTVGGVPFGGPGVPEPPSNMVAKAWKTKAFSNTVGEYWVYFWKLLDGRVLMWNAAQNEAKIWKIKKPIIGPVYRDKLNLKQYVKMERYLDSVTKTIAKRTKALKRA